ncbi:thioredoxin domain-containing protein [Candidatus Saccharibacteria bacterium]|nr:thioredoxin domain-containing protein [Candidatus Saccharibacteria bacterium]
MLGKIVRNVAIVAIIGVLVALVIFNANQKAAIDTKVWDSRTTIGDAATAKHHYIMYTDLMCPYCDAFSRVVKDHYDEFKCDYLDEKKVLFEMRITDFLYEFGAHKTEYSRQSAEAIYCATAEDRFWDYYYAALDKLWEDYHSKGIGTSKTSPAITGIDDSYWLEIGKSIGLGEEFNNCYSEHQQLEAVKANTAKAYKLVDGGLPYFQFGSFKTGGFDQSWGWEQVKQYLDAGLQGRSN